MLLKVARDLLVRAAAETTRDTSGDGNEAEPCEPTPPLAKTDQNGAPTDATPPLLHPTTTGWRGAINAAQGNRAPPPQPGEDCSWRRRRRSEDHSPTSGAPPSTRQRLDMPLQQPAAAAAIGAAIDRVIQAGVRSVDQVGPQTLSHLKNLVADRVGCLSLSAADACIAEARAQKVLTSGCPGVDRLLGAGFTSGDIVEFAGPPATGKTQLSYFAIVSALATRASATALFFDSGGSFCADRIGQLFAESDRFAKYRGEGMTATSILSRVRCAQCFDAFDFLGALYSLQHHLAHMESDFVRNLSLIVVDSVGAIFSPVSGRPQGATQITTCGRILRLVSRTVNYAVTSSFKHAHGGGGGGGGGANDSSGSTTAASAGPGAAQSSGRDGARKPALGPLWADIPTATLFFSRPPSAESEESAETEARASDAASSAAAGGASVRVLTYENRAGQVIQVRRRRVEVIRNSDPVGGDMLRKSETGGRWYYEGGVSSVYMWDLDEGFAAVVLIKKITDDASKTAGTWDSIHVVEVQEKGRSAHYKLTSTVMLNLTYVRPALGNMKLAGSLTRQAEHDMTVEDYGAHVANIGRVVEDMEIKMRNNLHEIYFGKTKDIANDLRAVQSLAEARRQAFVQAELVGKLRDRNA
ncbi:hypothetical protein HK405_008392 [Cladochytrium tenue]|nr:hypothetical protein HK405_008392 [Cladochytrium tenue]